MLRGEDTLPAHMEAPRTRFKVIHHLDSSVFSSSLGFSFLGFG